MMSKVPAVATLLAILATGLILRLGAIAAGPGYAFDIAGYRSWAARLAAVGPAGFYDPARVVEYPPGLLYLLWPLGSVFGDVPDAVIRGLSIPFDLAIVVLLFVIVRRARGDRGGLAACALYALNPAVVLAGPYWGQVDAIATLPMLLALVAAAAGRPAFAGSLAAVAALIKPQAVLGLMVLGVVGLAAVARRRDARPLLATVVAAALTTAAVALPFAFTPATLGGLIRDATTSHAFSSVFALNLWALGSGFVPDDRLLLGIQLRIWGIAAFSIAALFVAARIWSLVSRERTFGRAFVPELAMVFAGTALLVFALYELPTRVHERYLFPALALLAPFAIASRRALAAYLAVTLVLAVAVLFALTHQDPAADRAAPALERILFDPSTLVLIVLLGLLAMGWFAVGWVRRRPALA